MAGVLDVLYASKAPYRIVTVGIRRTRVRTACGVILSTDRRLNSRARPVDTLIVAGPGVLGGAPLSPAARRAIVSLAKRARRIVAVCTGILLLAECGIANTHRVALHWSLADHVVSRWPELQVDVGRLFVQDGKLLTTAGATAGIDLALSLVEEDFGRDAALRVAKHLLVESKRDGTQSQFSPTLAMQSATDPRLRALLQWAVQNLSSRLDIATLAKRSGQSPRHFAREFARRMGTTPARYIEQLRVAAARVAIESSADSLEGVAARCGFGSAEVMRRAFVRVLSARPGEFRSPLRSPLH